MTPEFPMSVPRTASVVVCVCVCVCPMPNSATGTIVSYRTAIPRRQRWYVLRGCCRKASVIPTEPLPKGFLYYLFHAQSLLYICCKDANMYIVLDSVDQTSDMAYSIIPTSVRACACIVPSHLFFFCPWYGIRIGRQAIGIHGSRRWNILKPTSYTTQGIANHLFHGAAFDTRRCLHCASAEPRNLAI